MEITGNSIVGVNVMYDYANHSTYEGQMWHGLWNLCAPDRAWNVVFRMAIRAYIVVSMSNR